MDAFFVGAFSYHNATFHPKSGSNLSIPEVYLGRTGFFYYYINI